jgi:RNA-binding protein
MPSPLSPRERAHLKARAHALEPLVQIGHAGVTPQVMTEVDRGLAAHELIKVRIASADRDGRAAAAEAIAAGTDSTVVHRVGKVVVLWRPRPDAGGS